LLTIRFEKSNNKFATFIGQYYYMNTNTVLLIMCN